jgi:Golgi nucleoside diphosphatase
MNDIIIVEVPHSGRVMVWRALDEADLIQKAFEAHDFCHEEWTMENAVDCFGDEIPDEYNDILKKDKKVVVIGWSGQTECYSPADADSEIVAAKEAIGHDLSQCYFLSVAEAKAFKGHADVEIALNKYIADNDYLFGEEV